MRLEVVADLELDRVAGAGRVEPDESLRLGGGEPVVRLRHFAMELDRLAFHSVLAPARVLVTAHPSLDRALEQERDVRARKRVRPYRVQTARAPLVGDRGVA